MRIVAIPNLSIKVWTRKCELPQGNFLRSLTQPEITRQTTFELMDIEYDQINDESTSMECLEYNTSIVRNIMDVYDIEDFENL